MKRLICVFGLTGCLTVQAPVPPPVPRDSYELDLRVEFAQGEAPREEQLFVCGKVEEGKLWCVDYQLFQAHGGSQP